MTETLPLSNITKDSDLQMRVAINEQAVTDYAEVIRSTPVGEGVPLPPVVVFRDKKKLYLVDGFHRHEGHVRAGATEIQAEVIEGTKREAILYSVGANANHGLRRTNEDKRKAVLTLLNDKEWSGWSDREIARQCAVDHKTVGRLRDDHLGNSPDSRTVERSGTIYDQNTTNIGKSQRSADAADHAEAKAEKSRRQAEEQAENDRSREEARAALPDSIRQMDYAKAEATAEREFSEETSGLTAEDEIAELRAAVACLEAENETLRAENKLYSEMKAEFDKGGFAEVIAGKEKVIQNQAVRLESESAEKVKNLRSADWWKAEAIKLGWSNREDIPVKRRAKANA